MFHLTALAIPSGLFDAAAKVTSSWALGAFAIAAVVAILLGIRSRKKSAQFPIAAVIVIVTAIVVPVAGTVAMASFPDTPYRVTVTVVNKAGGVVSEPHVTSSTGVPPINTEGGGIFEISPSDIPADHQATFWADKNNSLGKTVAKFERGRSILVTVTLEDAAAPTPEPSNADNLPTSLPSGLAVLLEGWTHYDRSAFVFKTANIVAWNDPTTDILVAAYDKDHPNDHPARFMIPYDKEPYLDPGAKAGIQKMSVEKLDDLTECPVEDYQYHWVDPQKGDIFCLRTRDGHHYAKIKVEEVLPGQISFDWIYQPSGARIFPK